MTMAEAANKQEAADLPQTRTTRTARENEGRPCTGCPNFEVCRVESLACHPFVEWVRDGKPRQPDLVNDPPNRDYLVLIWGED